MDNAHDRVTADSSLQTSSTSAGIAAPAAPAAAAANPPAAEKPGVEGDVLIEALSIDGMCGVY